MPDSAFARDSLVTQASLLSELMAMAIEPQLERSGITLSTFELLSSVKAAGRDATQAELSRRLGITPPSLSESVKGAAAAGLVEQQASNADRRVRLIVLTARGKRILGQILQGVNQIESRVVEGIEPSELRAAVAVLKTANRNLARSLRDS
jgi:DNA-binding MarR family transcriptional regulator